MPKTDPARYSDPVRATRTRIETGRLMGCAPNSVDTMMDNGDLTFVQIGNRRQPTVASIEKRLGRPIQELEAALHAAPPATRPSRQPTPPATQPSRQARRRTGQLASTS